MSTKWTASLQSIYEEFLPRYKKEFKNFEPEKLRNLILKLYQDANENWNRLIYSRTTVKNIYVKHWIETSVDRYLASKNVRKISSSTPPAGLKASVEIFSIIQNPIIIKLKSDIRNQFPERYGIENKTEEIWKNSNLPFKGIEKKFTDSVVESNNIIQTKGFAYRVEWALDWYKIPNKDFDIFIKDIDQILNYCNSQLPKLDYLPDGFYSSFGSHCFLCQLPNFPFKGLDEVLDYVTGEYKLIKKFRNKIIVELGNNSRISYRKETDDFLIIIEQDQNIRHKSMDLIHELSHAIYYLTCFQKNIDPFEKGAYINEKERLKIELKILKKLSPQLYKSKFGEYLSVFHSVLFQIELYKNPRQDLSKLYAETFNKCFKGAKQKTNPLYILDNVIVLKPLSNLPHAVAQASMFLKRLN